MIDFGIHDSLDIDIAETTDEHAQRLFFFFSWLGNAFDGKAAVRDIARRSGERFNSVGVRPTKTQGRRWKTDASQKGRHLTGFPSRFIMNLRGGGLRTHKASGYS